MEEQKKEERGLNDQQTISLANELTNHALARLAEEGATAGDMLITMATTLVLAVESTAHAMDYDIEEMYEAFDDALTRRKALAERAKSRMNRDMMKGHIGTELNKKVTDFLIYGKDAPQA